VNAIINGKSVEFAEHTTILEAARAGGQFIPTLCELADIGHTPGTCRMCIVEVTSEGQTKPQLLTACDTPIEAGMVISTRTQKVRQHQRLQMELLLADHNQDCASCVRHGDCELQDTAQFVGLQNTRFSNPDYFAGRCIDRTSPSIVRDMTKCVRCQRCLAVCRDVQGTDVLVFTGKGVKAEIGVRDSIAMSDSTCISCGQCTLVCPVGALAEKDDTERVIDYFYDPDIFTVVQIAPATRVALGEEFNMGFGENVEGKLISAFEQLGADVVLDTNFTADLVIMEEGNELLQRVTNGGTLPMFTSCSPGWVNWLEKNHPERLDNLSTVKSPQQCFGAVAKTYLADKMHVDPKKMRVVSIMPCTAKKEEAGRPEFKTNGRPDVDVVLTTRECARLLKREGVWLPGLPEGKYNNEWMGQYSGAAEIFGTTGGVTEAAIRTLHFAVTGNELEGIDFLPIRGYENMREADVDLGDKGVIKVGVAHGLAAAKTMIERVNSGEADYTFIEFMGCPGGCMGGGGQPRIKKNYQTFWHERQKAIYQIDKDATIRQSHNNPCIQKIYEEFLGEPLGHKSHELLHTTYRNRKVQVKHDMKTIWDEIRS
jgi:ferredoxin hydrogenase gamma subunit